MNIKLIITCVIVVVGILLSIQCSIAPQGTEIEKKRKKIDSSQYKALGINTEHLFIFDETSMTYNGKPFMVGQTIDEFVALFGPYDRQPKRTIYIWDEIGIILTTPIWNNPDFPDIDRVNNFYIYWNLDMSEESSPTTSKRRLEMRKEMVERSPKNFFKGKIIVNGAPLGRGMSMDDFRKEARGRWSNDPFPVRYEYELDDFNYSKAPIYKREEYVYHIRTSNDYSDIETFTFGRVTRR